MSESFEVNQPDQVTIGTVGEPGQRTFFLQSVDGGASLSPQMRSRRIVTLKLEKQQVAALGELLGDLLSDLPTGGQIPADVDLVEPAVAAWAVTEIQLGYDRDLDRVLVVAKETEDADAAAARFFLTREQAAALVRRSAELVEAGRPPCPWCGHPLDPGGHSCPRTNGHRPPAP